MASINIFCYFYFRINFFSISMFDQIENISFERQKDDQFPRSCCSIEEDPNEKKVRFNLLNEPYPLNKIAKSGASDRYLPLRKTPGSSKDLYLDHLQWKQEEALQRNEKKGLSLVDVYKMQVLKEQKVYEKETDIKSFVNSNLLKFQQNENESKSQKFPSQGYFRFQEEKLPSKTVKARKINKVPVKVLDAPALYDDFYLNLVDWSASNLLSVGLSNSVYIWNASNSKVVRLVELSQNDLVTSTSSSPTSNILGVGTHSGQVQLWDCIKNKKTFTYSGHTGRVGAIAWNTNNVFASGSRDKSILVRDIRAKDQVYINKLLGHKQEVCGLKWSFDQQQLASGGNDNRLNIWSTHSSMPTASLLKHTAAVKALAWSPHQHGLLVSGGGTADRTIRFWNSMSGQQTKCLEVGSQVCNLIFSKTVNQLVSTHGYSLNQINIWRMPQMQKIQTLTGHTFRVLYLAMNPDGTTIVTGAGDETLRFWSIFPKKEKQTEIKSRLVFDSICIR